MAFNQVFTVQPWRKPGFSFFKEQLYYQDSATVAKTRAEVEMYEIKRQSGRVIITRANAEVFNAPETAYVIYEKDGSQKISIVKDLPDTDLLLALANAVFIKQ